MIRHARQLTIDALHGTNRHTIFDNRVGVDSIAQAVDLNARIIAHVHTIIDRHSESETRTPRETQKVMESLGATCRLQALVHLGQSTRQRLAISKQIGVVVDPHGQTKSLAQVVTQRHTLAQAGECRKEAATDDSARIVCRTGEGKADRHRRLLELRHYTLETLDKGLHTEVEIVGIRRQRNRLSDKLIGTDCAKDEVGSARIERYDCTRIVAIHSVAF